MSQSRKTHKSQIIFDRRNFLMKLKFRCVQIICCNGFLRCSGELSNPVEIKIRETFQYLLN